jgi:hypothetical protein
MEYYDFTGTDAILQELVWSLSLGSPTKCPIKRYSSLQPYHGIFFYLLICILCDKMKRVDASVVYLIEGRRPSAV